MGVEVVLERDRDAVERSADSASAALRVEFIGDLQSVRVDLDHRAKFGALPVHGFDAPDVGLGDGAGGVFARLHHALEVGGGDLVEFERRDLALSACGRWRLGGGRGTREVRRQAGAAGCGCA